ncbi:MAG TPA: cysteine desulfurase family protein [Candidatus Saccharimonadales bacterium]|nr:cysteine desulfurase family protein [Candidatus Saccharimonadales bacterium]
MTSKTVYMDYAAATPLDPAVLATMQPYFRGHFYNPSATYSAALAVHRDLEKARGDVALVFGCRPSEVVFTAGGTEANNVAIHGVMRRYPKANMVVSAVEHDSVLAPAGEYTCKLLPVTAEGIVEVGKLPKLVDDATVLVSVMYANNEVGSIQPIKEVSRALEVIRNERRKKGNKLPLYLHTDACQAAGYLDLHVSRLGVDLMSVNGGKIYGPKQSGALYVRGGLQLSPLVAGGGQENGLRSGTENVAGCIGFATALTIAQEQRSDEVSRLQKLQKQFMEQLEQAVPSVVINGSRKHRLPNNIHVTIPGQDNERLLIQLDEAGVQAAAGSACSASNEEPSHVLKAMGISEVDAQASLRFTLGRPSTASHVGYVVETLARLLA